MNFQEDLKTAMLAKDDVRTRTLRGILTAIKNETIQKCPGGELSQDDIVIVLKRMVKSRQDSVALFIQGGAQDRADQENQEILVIQEYLPQMLEGEALRIRVQGICAAQGLTQKKQMGLVMKTLKEEFGSAFDGKQASTFAGEFLS